MIMREGVFEDFERVAIASGSIAQVHVGQYKGRTVAVKVRHPRVEQEIQMDFDLMQMLARYNSKLLIKL